MAALCLISKLLSDIDDSPSSVTAAMLSPWGWGDWYGHIFTIKRHKCILFINEPTLFVSLSCWVVTSQYRCIVPFFLESLTLTLRNHLFDPDEINYILGLHEDLTVGKALKRSMISSLNNRIANAKSMIEWRGGYNNCDWRAINILLNQTPMKPIGYSNGLEQMRALLAGLKRSQDHA